MIVLRTFSHYQYLVYIILNNSAGRIAVLGYSLYSCPAAAVNFFIVTQAHHLHSPKGGWIYHTYVHLYKVLVQGYSRTRDTAILHLRSATKIFGHFPCTRVGTLYNRYMYVPNTSSQPSRALTRDPQQHAPVMSPYPCPNIQYDTLFSGDFAYSN